MTKLNATASTLLGFLHDRSMTGWELQDAVRLTIGPFWNVNLSQIYRELRTLEAEEMVVGGERGTRDKRPYTITDLGRAAFRDWIAQEPGEESARYPLLVTMWFSDHLPEEQLDWFLRLHRERHRKLLDFYENLYDDFEDHTTPAARTLRFGLFYERAVNAWFESLPMFGGTEPAPRHSAEPRFARPKKPADFDAEPETT